MDAEHSVRVLPHKGSVGAELRKLYFYQAMGRSIDTMRILSFGACNFVCPYCKRDGAFQQPDGTFIVATKLAFQEIVAILDDAMSQGQIIRLSGGDPALFPLESLAIGEHVRKCGGRLSIAHNGSSLGYVKKMGSYLESAAIDLKAIPSKMSYRSGLRNTKAGEYLYKTSLDIQDYLANTGVLVDVRTPVFGDTSYDEMMFLASDISSRWHENKFWTWRAYNPVKGCDWLPLPFDEIIGMIEAVKKNYPNLKIGLRANWESSKFFYF